MKKLPWQHELRHHGVLGQKWGRRQGPPYPLAPGRHSAAEKKAGWQKSLDSKSRSQGDIPGGGGGAKEENEDEKILKELYAELDRRSKKLGVTPIEMISGQNFGLTLAEEIGVYDELSKADIERLRKKALDHYSRNSTERNQHEALYGINEGILAGDKAVREVKSAKETNSNKKYIDDKLTIEIADTNTKKYIDDKITIELADTKSDEATKDKSIIDNAKKWINDHLSGTITYRKKEDD